MTNIKDQSRHHLEEHIPVRLAHQDPGLDLEVRENEEIREVVAIQEDQVDQLVIPASTRRSPEQQAESQQVHKELFEDRIRNLEQYESKIADTSEGLFALRSYFDIKLSSRKQNLTKQTADKVSKKLKLSNYAPKEIGNSMNLILNNETLLEAKTLCKIDQESI